MIKTPRSPWGYTAADLLKAAAEAANLSVVAMHMCPECGWPARTFCPTCKGNGVVTALELDMWQRREDRKIAGGSGD
jgi:hypothetical protein